MNAAAAVVLGIVADVHYTACPCRGLLLKKGKLGLDWLGMPRCRRQGHAMPVGSCMRRPASGLVQAISARYSTYLGRYSCVTAEFAGISVCHCWATFAKGRKCLALNGCRYLASLWLSRDITRKPTTWHLVERDVLFASYGMIGIFSCVTFVSLWVMLSQTLEPIG